MAHMIPETMLEFDPQGREDVVFNALKCGLDDDYWVLHSCNVNQTGRDGAFYEKEVDFVIYHREKGILCLEVKNGRGISYYGGVWRYSSGQPMPHHGPFKQAQLERISICNLLTKRGEETSVIKGVGKHPEMAAGALPGTKPELVFVDPKMESEDYAVAVGRRIAKLREDFAAADIVVLSCSPYGDGHSRLERKLTPMGNGGRMFNQAYRFSTYRKFKGLDAPVIVLVDVDRSAFVGVHNAMPFYEGASRARQRLVVFASMSDEDCADVAAAYSGKKKESVPLDCARARFADVFCMAGEKME